MKEKILVLEDEIGIRSFVSINLKREGYEIIEAGTGAEAIEKINENNEDIKVLAQKYDVEESIIEFMLDKRCRYSYKMLEIASDYLEIPYDELTAILEDDEKISPRANTDEDTGELFGIINYMFNEMIKHKRLSCE